MTFLLRGRDREAMLGDLMEEQALLAKTLPPAQVARWGRRQALVSIPPVVWANIRRGGWLRTLGAALAGYIVIALLVIATDTLMGRLLKVGIEAYSAISLAVGLGAMMAGGYVTARLRPSAAVVLACLCAVMGLASLRFTGDGAPLWYQIALIFTGPGGALAGAGWRPGWRNGRV